MRLKHLDQGESGIINTCPQQQNMALQVLIMLLLVMIRIDVAKQLLKSLEFRLSYAYGTTIGLRGLPISLSLIFMPQMTNLIYLLIRD